MKNLQKIFKKNYIDKYISNKNILKVGDNMELKELFDDGCMEAVYKLEEIKGYCQIEDKKIDLIMVADIKDLREWMPENDIEEINNPVVLEIGIIPAIYEINEKIQKDRIADMGNNELLDDPFYLNNDNLIFDIISYMGMASYISLDQYNFKDFDQAEEYLKTDKNLEDNLKGIMMLIGFQLDKPVNRIGNDGWYFLNKYL